MFFSWFAKNRNFNKRHNLSGQIMPFLLVIIAIFLGAYITTVNIGKVAMNMTCNDNAADACALAAASHMALAMNTFKRDAELSTGPNFADFQTDLKTLSISIDNNLVQAKSLYITARSLINSAISQGGPGGYCDVWHSNRSASTSLSLANELLRQALVKVVTADTLALAMESGVSLFQFRTRLDYCGAIDYLNLEYLKAKSDGVKYALENNCVYPNLSAGQQADIQNGIDQQDIDEENAQLIAEGSLPPVPGYPEASPNAPIDNDRQTTYNWNDSKGNAHSMGATVEIPKIASFELEVTKMNKPCDAEDALYNNDPYSRLTLNFLREILVDVREVLESSSIEENNIYIDTVNAVNRCWQFLGNWWCCFWRYLGFNSRANTIVSNLNQLIAPISNSILELDTIRQQNKDVLKALAPPEGGKRIISSFGCADAGDVIIIGINDVKFEAECIECKADMSHAGDASSGSSWSSFGGGSLSASQPSSTYAPQILNTDTGCSPGEGGVTTGTTTDSLNHNDEGCN